MAAGMAKRSESTTTEGCVEEVPSAVKKLVLMSGEDRLEKGEPSPARAESERVGDGEEMSDEE